LATENTENTEMEIEIGTGGNALAAILIDASDQHGPPLKISVFSVFSVAKNLC
jgi:hypothetical protein